MPIKTTDEDTEWVVTANRTSDGHVVYLTGTSAKSAKWNPALALATIQTVEARDELVAWATTEQQRQVCDPYFIPVSIAADGTPEVESAREQFRARGGSDVRIRFGYA